MFSLVNTGSVGLTLFMIVEKGKNGSSHSIVLLITYMFNYSYKVHVKPSSMATCLHLCHGVILIL